MASGAAVLAVPDAAQHTKSQACTFSYLGGARPDTRCHRQYRYLAHGAMANAFLPETTSPRLLDMLHQHSSSPPQETSRATGFHCKKDPLYGVRTSWRADSRSCECACTPYLLVPTSHSSGDVSLQGVARRRRVGRAHPHAFLQKGLEIRFLRRRVASIPPCPEAQFASSNCWTDGCRVHLAPSPYRFLCQSLFIQVAPFLGRRKILSPPASGGNNLVSLGVGASCEPVLRNCGVARADDCGTMRSKMPIYLRWL